MQLYDDWFFKAILKSCLLIVFKNNFITGYSNLFNLIIFSHTKFGITIFDFIGIITGSFLVISELISTLPKISFSTL